MLRIVVIKLIAPITEDAPAQCELKIARSAEPPEEFEVLIKGGILFILFLHLVLPGKSQVKETWLVLITRSLDYLI